MNEKKLMFFSLIVILLVIFSACNLRTTPNTKNQNEGTPPPEAQPLPSQLPDFNLEEPCSILSEELVKTVLGPQARIIPPSECMYYNGKTAIIVAILQGEIAKLARINEILQLQNNCTLQYTVDPNQPGPTPIPAEAEYLLDESIPDLVQQSLVLQESCGMGSFEQFPEYGPNVYVAPFEAITPGGMAVIADEEYTLSIVIADMEQDTAALVEEAKLILEMLFAGD